MFRDFECTMKFTVFFIPNPFLERDISETMNLFLPCLKKCE
jgi:hypothetical protein